MDTKYVIKHEKPFPVKHESKRWASLVGGMLPGDHVTLNSWIEAQACANCMRNLGMVPRTNRKTLTVWRRL